MTAARRKTDASVTQEVETLQKDGFPFFLPKITVKKENTTVNPFICKGNQPSVINFMELVGPAGFQYQSYIA